MRRSALLLACVLLASVSAAAQEREVELEAPLQTTLGDPIDVILTARVMASDEAAVPEQPMAPFEVIATKVEAKTSDDQKSKTYTFELRLLCFEAGTHRLGPLHVRVTTPQSEVIDLESQAREIEVQSLLANEPDPQLKPPTEPVPVEQDDYRLLIGLGALGALALGAILAWLLMRWWQRRERPEPALPPPPPPWETALAELEELSQRRSNEIAEGRTEQWVDAVSDSVRKYLGARFGFPGLESTTDEVAHVLGAKRAQQELSIAPEDALAFLGQCDLVKFAKASLAEEASLALVGEARALVEKTRPAQAAAARGPS